ncbi:hypothetical protein [Sicyoidochytrium minutum DNA virus]|nr:hypothetical protein [Sicyoidochytrium minutum DNA virus]
MFIVVSGLNSNEEEISP